MYLKNYTSDVAASITIGRIQALLLRCGVKSIQMEYGTRQEVTAITFQIPMMGRDMWVRLPADVEQTIDAMWQGYKEEHPSYYGRNRCRKTRDDFKQQGERTAWKLAQDWIEVEMSRVMIQRKEAAEIFMAYLWDGQETLYNRIKSNGFRALLPERSESTINES